MSEIVSILIVIFILFSMIGVILFLLIVGDKPITEILKNNKAKKMFIYTGPITWFAFLGSHFLDVTGKKYIVPLYKKLEGWYEE